jgi:hypothetical protein
VRQELVLSSQIEGTQSSLSDLLLFELGEAPGVPFDEVVEVSNYVAASKIGVELLREGLPIPTWLCCRCMPVCWHADGAQRSPLALPPLPELDRRTRPGNAQFVLPHRI